ncbi:uncharacterized protein BJX67DRAFT_378469 [Aspergillus lucknowensis]|uniref:Uncharacterized protein n=1 Tax=Aspergillus lucknowensis TaxID=176173 RepID=A0ABR4M177_9EURO
MATEPLYPAYLPVRPERFTPTLDVPAFDANDPGLHAYPELEILTSTAAQKNITPRVGAEIRDLQLSQLTQDGLDQVALLASQRGVLVFFGGCPAEESGLCPEVDVGPEKQLSIAKHFGPLLKVQ